MVWRGGGGGGTWAGKKSPSQTMGSNEETLQVVGTPKVFVQTQRQNQMGNQSREKNTNNTILAASAHTATLGEGPEGGLLKTL